MITFRHKKSWLIWIVGLALVVTGALSPAQAFACAERPAPIQATQAGNDPKHCAGMEQNAPCCCGPGEKLTKAQPAAAGATLTNSGCGCTVQAPDAPPAPATKSSALVFAPEVALLAISSLEIELPRSAPWAFAAPATGPPQSSVCPTGPSRAPPAL